MTPQRYEQLKAKIVGACPEVQGTHIHTDGRPPAPCKCTEAPTFFPITIAHVLRTLGNLGRIHRAVATADTIYLSDLELFSKFDLTRNLDGQSDEVKEWLADIILKDE